MDEVIVIGGGLAGCATAYYLARGGIPVRLIERGTVNGLASSANAGSIHAQIPHDPFRTLGPVWAEAFQPALRLFQASIHLWRGLESELGADLEIAFGGGLLVAETPEELREVESKAEIERAAGLQIDLLDRNALRATAPYLTERAVGGAFCPIEGKANPLLVAPAFAARAQRLGAVIERWCGPAAIERGEQGYRVETAQAVHHARRVVVAAGSETGLLLKGFAPRLQRIQAMPIQVSVTEPAEAFLPHLVYSAGAKLTMKQTRIGTVLIGGGWDAQIDNQGRPLVDLANLQANLTVARSTVPQVAGLALVRTWAAFVNGTADWLPIIGELEGSPGLFVNYVPWMGFTGGPAAAMITAALVEGHEPQLDVPYERFRP